jgi:glycosyltransferase involved in cell wall biosynthesis
MITIACIIKDEEKQLPGLLEAFKGLDAKWLFVDTGSSDDSLNILKKTDAEVLKYTWKDDFSAARNFALEKVRSPWVMMVDADYRIKKKELSALKKYLNEHHESLDVITLKTEFNGGYAELPRLWKTEHQLRYTYPVHECLQIPSNLRKNHCEVSINANNDTDYVSSRKYYVKLMKAFLEEHPEDIRMHFYLVSDLYFLDEYESFAKYSQRYLDLNPPDDYQVAQVFIMMGYTFWNLDQREKAKEFFQSTMKFDKNNIESYLALGDLFYQEKDFKTALEWYTKAEELKLPKADAVFRNPYRYEVIPKRNIALTLTELGDFQAALKYTEQVLQIDSKDKEMQALSISLKKRIC